jgi:hypothetical protein
MTQTESLLPVGDRVMFEDEQVRVWEIEVQPGGRLPLHHHGLDYVTISLTEADLEAHEADGTVRRNHRVPGDVQVTTVGGGQRHELRNVGSTVYRNRLIEFKVGLPSGEGAPVNVNLPSSRR